ncbi:MAG: anti-sigma factor [Acidimicrobiales bacterium]
MRSDDDILLALSAALEPEPRSPSAAQVAALRRAAHERRAGDVPAALARARRRWWTGPALAVGAAAAVVVAFVAGTRLPDEAPPPAPVEFQAVLRSADGTARAEVTGTKVGIGRIVRLATDDLPILPTGELYEVWFVGPGDRPGHPDRISAGTFHPDAEGRSDVELTAAVVPIQYPVIAVTAEPGDGDPAPSEVEVLRAAVEL